MQWNLIRLRKEAGMTQQDVADKLGISVTTYTNKENGRHQFRANEMFYLRNYFGIPLDSIFLPTDCNDNAIDVGKE